MTRRGEENKKGSKMKTKDKQFMKEKMRKEGKGEEKKKENLYVYFYNLPLREVLSYSMIRHGVFF